jgi:membrane-associated phospholipid phosphatase
MTVLEETRVILSKSFDGSILLSLLLIALVFLPASAAAQIGNSPDNRPYNSRPGNSLPQGETQAAQQNPTQAPATYGITHAKQYLKDLGLDQAGIWTSPLRISPKDAYWLVPFAAGTAVALHYDARAQQNLGIDKTRIDTSNTVSAFGSSYATFGEAAGLYFLGLGTHNDHLAETGRLGAEAVADATLVVEALKLASDRERPNEGNGQGGFWPHGARSYESDGSFPSGHAAASWALARVIASEYPSKRVQVAAYAFALAISASRLTAR